MKERGFSLVEGLLIVLVISVVGFGGWYVANQDDEETQATNTTQAETNNEQNVEEHENVDNPSDLTVTEYSLKVTTAKVSDLTYSVTVNETTGDTLSFRSSTLNKLYPECTYNSVEYYIGKGDTVVEANFSENTKTFLDYYNENTGGDTAPTIKAGEYYLVPRGFDAHGSRYCSTDNESTSNEYDEKTIIENITKTAESIEVN